MYFLKKELSKIHASRDCQWLSLSILWLLGHKRKERVYLLLGWDKSSPKGRYNLLYFPELWVNPHKSDTLCWGKILEERVFAYEYKPY